MVRVQCSDCSGRVRVLSGFTGFSSVEVWLLEQIDLPASLMRSSFWKVPPPLNTWRMCERWRGLELAAFVAAQRCDQ